MKQQEGISLPPRSGKLLNLYQGAVDRVQALQVRLGEMERELEAVKRERDAAVNMLESLKTSDTCIRKVEPETAYISSECFLFTDMSEHIFRAICPENTEMQEDE